MPSDTAEALEQDAAGLYRVGGISALALGIAYIAIFPLYAHVGAPPVGDGEAWLRYLVGKTSVWWAILALSVLTDLLFVPVGLSLYVALKAINRNAMLLATAFVGLFVVLDLAVTWSSYASLLTLGDRYAAATNDVQRAAYVAAAHGASAMLASRLEVVYAIVILSSAILVIGFVMLKGVFSRTTAYLAVLTGISGIVSIAGWSLTIITNAVLATLWLLFVGYRLCRLARK
jgi:hypothetical protein